MHELSIAQALLREALAAARSVAAGREISGLYLELGELSGAVPELLREAWPLAAEGSALAGARLRIKRVKARFECRDCGGKLAVGEGVTCPDCGGRDLDMAAGREIRLTGLEVDEKEGDEA